MLKRRCVLHYYVSETKAFDALCTVLKSQKFWTQNLNNEVLLPNRICQCSRIEMSIDGFHFVKMLKSSLIKVTVTGETLSFCLRSGTFFVSFSLISLTLQEIPWYIITVSYFPKMRLTIQHHYSFLWLHKRTFLSFEMFVLCSLTIVSFIVLNL